MFKAVAVASTLALTNAISVANNQESFDGPHCIPNVSRIGRYFKDMFDRNHNEELDLKEQLQALEFLDKFFFDVPQEMFEHLNDEGKTTTSIEDALGLAMNLEKMTQFALSYRKEGEHGNLNREEFAKAVSFFENVFCSFDDQVFDHLDTDNNGTIDGPEVTQGLLLLLTM